MIAAYPATLFFKQWGVFGEDGEYVGDKKLAGAARDGRTFDRTPWSRDREALERVLEPQT